MGNREMTHMSLRSIVLAIIVVATILGTLQAASSGELGIVCVEVGNNLYCKPIDVGWEV